MKTVELLMTDCNQGLTKRVWTIDTPILKAYGNNNRTEEEPEADLDEWFEGFELGGWTMDTVHEGLEAYSIIVVDYDARKSYDILDQRVDDLIEENPYVTIGEILEGLTF